MHKILVSACLVGQPVRFDGQSKAFAHPFFAQWLQEGRLVFFCPECAGGLAVPRPAAEIQANGRVMTQSGLDVTEAFEKGAELALARAREAQVCCAILKANSPSCGNERVYDGRFLGQRIVGQGLTAQRLTQAGIPVFNELQMQQVQTYLQQLETADRHDV